MGMKDFYQMARLSGSNQVDSKHLMGLGFMTEGSEGSGETLHSWKSVRNTICVLRTLLLMLKRFYTKL